MAATGDDKVNLVVSLLAKTEYGVPRTVARVSNPKNEWMFDEAWGVDVAVSMPRLMTALVEEAVSVGDLVRIFTFQQSQHRHARAHPAGRLPRGRPAGSATSPGRRTRRWSRSSAEGRPIPPTPDDPLEAGDELLFVASPDMGPAARGAARPARPLGGRRRSDGLGRATNGVRPRASSQAIAARAATCSGQPSAIFVTPEPADLARRQVERVLHGDPHDAGQRQHQVSRLHSRTTAGSCRQAVMSPVTEASIRPDQRPADEHREHHRDRVRRVVEDAREEDVLGLAGAGARRRPRSAMPTRLLTTNCTDWRCTSRTASSTTARPMPTMRPRRRLWPIR